MKVKLDNVGGEVIKDNEVYLIQDNNYLNNMTLSRTFLKPGQSTRGHSHENEEEIYIFTHGIAFMQIDQEFHHAKSGDTFLIKAGQFHRVLNKSEDSSCAFTCVFEKYDRESKTAVYENGDS
jgi:quercetin dioxygenase-like cupin family protein